MKRTTRILVFASVLVLAFAAIIVPGVAADDIVDFIGKEEQLTCERQPTCDEQPVCYERPVPRPFSSLQNSGVYHDDHIDGERLETRFDVAPALRGGATIPRLQPATISTQNAQLQISATNTAAEIEPEPISEFIPPPNTGRDTYLRWGALGGVLLLTALLPVLRKKVRQR